MTVRFKLTMAAIAVIVVANCFLSLTTVKYASDVWLDEVQTRVRRNLNSARTVYDSHADLILAYLRAATTDSRIAAAADQEHGGEAAALLTRLHREGKMEFLSLLDAKGRVVCRAWDGGPKRDDLSHNPLIAKVLEEGKPLSGTVILSREELE